MNGYANITFGDDATLAVDVNGTSCDLLEVKGSAALGASAGDDIRLVVRELGTPTANGYKILDAEGGVSIPGTLTVSGSPELTRYELRDGGTELWLLAPPPGCTLLQLR